MFLGLQPIFVQEIGNGMNKLKWTIMGKEERQIDRQRSGMGLQQACHLDDGHLHRQMTA